MSRFGDDDGDSPITPEMWRHNVELAIKGKRGQAALRELLLALDAVPGHRLTRDYLALPAEGMVCAVGALAAYRRIATGKAKDWDEAVSTLAVQYGIEPDGYEMGHIGHAEAGLTITLAQHLAYQNDEYYWEAKTPEELWAAIRDWAAKQLVPAQ